MSFEVELPPRRNAKDLLLEDPKFSIIISLLRVQFNPLHIYLFGSRASGLQREDSDYDFVVVVAQTNKHRIENMQLARQALSKVGVSADVFVYGREEFDEWKKELNSIPEAAYNLGVELPLG